MGRAQAGTHTPEFAEPFSAGRDLAGISVQWGLAGSVRRGRSLPARVGRGACVDTEEGCTVGVKGARTRDSDPDGTTVGQWLREAFSEPIGLRACATALRGDEFGPFGDL